MDSSKNETQTATSVIAAIGLAADGIGCLVKLANIIITNDLVEPSLNAPPNVSFDQAGG